MWSGMLAEFPTPERLMLAIRTLQRHGYQRLEAFTPYPLRPVEEALGMRRSSVNWMIFPVGLFGAGFAFFVQSLANDVLYGLNVGGRPETAIPAFIIIAFETMVLFSAVTAFVALFWLCRLPRLAHPVFAVEGFERASVDRFWLGIEVADPRFDPVRTETDLRALGASRVEFAGALR